VTALSMSLALLLAVCVNRVLRTNRLYTTLLVWPYAVAPVVVGILWWFMFNPTIGIAALSAARSGRRLEPSDRRHRRHDLVIIAASWKQISYNFLFFVAGLQSVPQSLIEAAAIDGSGPGQAVLDHRLPAALADRLLPADRQHQLRDVRHLRHHRRHDPGWSGAGDQSSSTRSTPTVSSASTSARPSAQSVHAHGIVIALTVIQFRWVERRVQY
jgi:sn-glycerol 3-phosphate transport system permease protein